MPSSYARKGLLIGIEPEKPTIERDTYTCCHCNRVIIVNPGSGKERGFCTMCMEPHCGGEQCWTCVPFERKLEFMELQARLRAQI